jgi:hypothetical protein
MCIYHSYNIRNHNVIVHYLFKFSLKNLAIIDLFCTYLVGFNIAESRGGCYSFIVFCYGLHERDSTTPLKIYIEKGGSYCLF